MKQSDIRDLFEDKISLQLFKEKIRNEVSVYKTKSIEKKTSISVSVNEDIETLAIKRKDALYLINTFINQGLYEWELNYIKDVLTLSENIIYENEFVEDAVHLFSEWDFAGTDHTKYIAQLVNDLKI